MQVQRAHKLLQSILTKRVPKRNAHHYEGPPMTTYNDLPIPQGSWQTHHDAMQRKYNAHLAMGIGFAIVTFAVAQMGGFFYFNYNEPKVAKAKNDYK
ncbi:PREDICTED: uncharacterized protein LOC108559365 [Nicrophorus vespilloides]|uniref:Uncharacterized protein LOC108559365 n=1 Tax=Nicrophorus vespilloides TaxID=110193 RepID=A0ABM1MC09_NICVS|nr:PREDICTED: uncharacterized protein LOC108559365 [Nicrophorus vespilloides]